MNIIEFGNVINDKYINNITPREWNEYENIFKEDLDKYEKKDYIIFVKVENEYILITDDYNSDILYKISTKKIDQKYKNNFLLYKGYIEDVESLKKEDIVKKEDNIKFTARILQTMYIKKNNNDIIYKVFFNKIYIYNEKKFIYTIKYKIFKDKHSQLVFENIFNKRKHVEQINSLKIKVITDLNNLISIKKNQNINDIEPNIFMTRPINIFRKDIPFLKNYLFFPKLDGYHYFVYYHNTGVYYINEKQVIIIKNKEKFLIPNSDFNNSIFLGELIKGEIYIFDSLFYKGLNLTKLPLLERLNYVKNTPLKILNYFKTPVEALEFNNTTSLPTDGIICVPTDKYYKNNFSFKWKPPNMLTIDFYVKFIRIDNNNQIFGLYNYNSSTKLELFKGNEQYPFSGEIILTNYIYDETIT